MRLSLDELVSYEPCYLSGSNGSCYVNRKQNIFVKAINLCLEYNKKNIETLCGFSVIENSGYPMEPLVIDDEIVGYVCEYYDKSGPFGSRNSFSLKEKCKAIGDTCVQLSELHKRDIIFNDMHSHNQLIDASGGHLIDFEDVWIPSIQKYPTANKFDLYFHDVPLSESKKVDQLKQYISSLGLIYQVDFERCFEAAANIEDLAEFFRVNSDVFDFLSRNLEKIEDSSVELLDYFDALLPVFTDEERISLERDQLLETKVLVRF